MENKIENVIIDRKFWKNKKVFITGHTGFKGTWLCVILSLLKSKIYGFALKPDKISLFNQTKISDSLQSNIYGDINNLNLLKKKLIKIRPEIVFHLAAQPLVIDSYIYPGKTFKTNIQGTVNLFESIKDINTIKSVVIITTDKVYKFNKKNSAYIETDELGGNDPYSASKACAELVVKSYNESFFKKKANKIKISTARSGNVIGGGDYSKNRLLPDIIKSINNKKKAIIRSPKSIRPWQHVIEPLTGYLLLAEKQFRNKVSNINETWNFGPKKENFHQVEKILNIIRKYEKFNFNIKKNNKFKETKILRLNSSKAKKKLNWSSKINLPESLKLVLDWNRMVKKNVPAKKVCEKQFLMYINK